MAGRPPTFHETAAMTDARTPIHAAINPLAPLRLTSFSHGGGCGCKIAPGVL
jgi:selenide,water dikinase